MLENRDLVNHYLNHDAGGKAFSRDTRVEYRRLLWNLTDLFNVKTMTEAQLVQYLKSMVAISVATRNAYISVYQSFFRWMHRLSYRNDDPTVDLRSHFNDKAQPTIEHSWLSADQVTRILETPPYEPSVMWKRDNILLRLGFTAGLRRAELVGLNWGDVDWAANEITLKGKGGKIATVALTKNTKQALHAWQTGYWEALGGDLSRLPVICPVRTRGFQSDPRARTVAAYGERLSTSGVYGITKRASEMHGIDFKPHDMRRTFAGIMYELGGMEAAQAALRHDNMATTQRYLQKRQDAAAQAVRKTGFNL